MEAPRLPSLFKARRPQQFDYKPRYFDALKDRHDRLRSEVQEGEKLRITNFREHWQSQRRHRIKSGQIVRLTVILAALAAAAWWLLLA